MYFLKAVIGLVVGLGMAYGSVSVAYDLSFEKSDKFNSGKDIPRPLKFIVTWLLLWLAICSICFFTIDLVHAALEFRIATLLILVFLVISVAIYVWFEGVESLRSTRLSFDWYKRRFNVPDDMLMSFAGILFETTPYRYIDRFLTSANTFALIIKVPMMLSIGVPFFVVSLWVNHSFGLIRSLVGMYEPLSFTRFIFFFGQNGDSALTVELFGAFIVGLLMLILIPLMSDSEEYIASRLLLFIVSLSTLVFFVFKILC